MNTRLEVLGKGLNASDKFAAEMVADQLIAWAERAAKRRGSEPLLHFSVWSDGAGSISHADRPFGSLSRPFSEALAEFLAWLERDQVAEVNATLGIE